MIRARDVVEAHARKKAKELFARAHTLFHSGSFICDSVVQDAIKQILLDLSNVLEVDEVGESLCGSHSLSPEMHSRPGASIP